MKPKSARNPKKGAGPSRLVAITVFVILVAVIVGAVVGGLSLLRNNSEGEPSATTLAQVVTITIKEGMGATQIGQLLEQAGLIASSAEFVSAVKARGSEDSLKPGIYKFTQGEELLALIQALEKGGEGLKFTIPEGLAIDQIAVLLNKTGQIDGNEYKSLAAEPDKFTVPAIGGSKPTVDTLEGLLFPSTYFLTEGSASELITAQLTAFASKTAALPWDNTEKLGVSPYEAVIIASMIEKEAKVPDERAKVAAVIYNRLNKNMTLGIDATVRYTLGKWTEALTEEDLKIDSPYNTRVNKGLPPTPISNPGIATLAAALEPEQADYLYYVLTDSDGHHFFTSSYDEFLKAKENAPSQ